MHAQFYILSTLRFEKEIQVSQHSGSRAMYHGGMEYAEAWYGLNGFRNYNTLGTWHWHWVHLKSFTFI